MDKYLFSLQWFAEVILEFDQSYNFGHPSMWNSETLLSPGPFKSNGVCAKYYDNE